jgi:hypothetical protein
MTLQELRDLIDTMGSNDEERNAQVVVNFPGAIGTYRITEGELLNGPEYTSPTDGDAYIPGLFLLLQAEQSR